MFPGERRRHAESAPLTAGSKAWTPPRKRRCERTAPHQFHGIWLDGVSHHAFNGEHRSGGIVHTGNGAIIFNTYVYDAAATVQERYDFPCKTRGDGALELAPLAFHHLHPHPPI